MSLDVEGPEIEILQTVDWKRLHVDVVSVEYRIRGKHKIDVPATLRKLRDVRRFFRETGIYHEAGVLPNGRDVDGLDIVFSRT